MCRTGWYKPILIIRVLYQSCLIYLNRNFFYYLFEKKKEWLSYFLAKTKHGAYTYTCKQLKWG